MHSSLPAPRPSPRLQSAHTHAHTHSHCLHTQPHCVSLLGNVCLIVYLRNTNFRLIGLSRSARVHVPILGSLHGAFLLTQVFHAHSRDPPLLWPLQSKHDMFMLGLGYLKISLWYQMQAGREKKKHHVSAHHQQCWDISTQAPWSCRRPAVHVWVRVHLYTWRFIKAFLPVLAPYVAHGDWKDKQELSSVLLSPKDASKFSSDIQDEAVNALWMWSDWHRQKQQSEKMPNPHSFKAKSIKFRTTSVAELMHRHYFVAPSCGYAQKSPVTKMDCRNCPSHMMSDSVLCESLISQVSYFWKQKRQSVSFESKMLWPHLRRNERVQSCFCSAFFQRVQSSEHTHHINHVV